MPEINQDTGRDSPLILQLYDPNPALIDDHLRGLESKKYALFPNSTIANPIVRVERWNDLPTLDLRRSKSALIENLIIDGKDYGVTGIKLENSYNTWIRNVTIKNCQVGVHIHLKYGAWSEFNHLEHVRMENVKRGIVFTTEGPNPSDPIDYPGDSAGFTAIDDVGIVLANDADAVGIQIGGVEPGSYLEPNYDVTSTVIKPYCSHIRANIWMQSAGGTGLKILNGKLQNSLINLAVQGPSNGNGTGIDIQNAYSIYHNQFSTFDETDAVISKGFLLATGGISVNKRVVPYVENDPTHDIRFGTQMHLWEHNNTGDSIVLQPSCGSEWAAQTFTIGTSNHNVYIVKLKLSRYTADNVGTVHAGIKAVDQYGHPTGADLTNGSFNGDTLPVYPNWTWIDIPLTSYITLNATAQYAIVVSAPTSTAYVEWAANQQLYSGGQGFWSGDSGSTWTGLGQSDGLFEVWGIL